MKVSNKQSQTGYTRRGILVVSILLVLGVGFLASRYTWQFEKLRAMSMQAMLINVLMAEEVYFSKKGIYTDQWKELLPHIAQPESLEPHLQAIDGQPQQYFIGFGPKALAKQDGYQVSLSLQADKKNGFITAKRTPNLFYHYELKREIFEGETQCVSTGLGKGFCNKMEKIFEEFSVKNLIPVPAQNTTGK